MLHLLKTENERKLFTALQHALSAATLYSQIAFLRKRDEGENEQTYLLARDQKKRADEIYNRVSVSLITGK